jgi:HD-GYP domain-containing protein (c-di-GMP phosphodiesterase class II)
MLLVTALVAVAPVLAALELEAANALTSPLEAIAAAAVIALLLHNLGARAWQRRSGTGDVLFGDLLIWGWVRRCVHEFRIWNSVRLLDGAAGVGWDAATDLRIEQRVLLLKRLATSLEARGGYTRGHSKRVVSYSAMIAAQLGLEGASLQAIRTAAAIHDVGKVDTAADVLCKRGKLTSEEFAMVKRHPVDGEYMVAPLDDPQIAAIVRHHHERLDGSGYPDRLTGDAIGLGARIVAVADTFDAITSSRSYRAARPSRVAIEILREQAGVTLDGDVVDAFCNAYLAKRRFARQSALAAAAERAITALATDAVTAGARLAAIAASIAALGTATLPALGPAAISARVTSHHPKIALTADRTPAKAAHPR